MLLRTLKKAFLGKCVLLRSFLYSCTQKNSVEGDDKMLFFCQLRTLSREFFLLQKNLDLDKNPLELWWPRSLSDPHSGHFRRITGLKSIIICLGQITFSYLHTSPSCLSQNYFIIHSGFEINHVDIRTINH